MSARLITVAAIAAIALVGCGLSNGPSFTDEQAHAGSTPTPPNDGALRTAALVPLAQPTASASATPTEADISATSIRVWWPDELYPAENTPAHDLLSSHFESFRVTYINYSLDIRRKRTNGLGSILSTLRAAQPVAPGAIPDLTLMRRSDMLTAATDGLILPLSDWISPDLAGSNLFPGVLALGQIDGELYGLPYALNVVHSAYRTAVYEEPLLTFSDVLAANPVWVFEANHTTTASASLILLLQYIAAGGRLSDDSGRQVLDREPLLAVLEFYEQAVEREIVNASLLQYDNVEDYWPAFANAQANVIGTDAWAFLRHKEAVSNTGLAPIPTLDGTPITSLDGWMWVLTTHDPDRQNRARVFLSWIMRISHHSLFSEAMGFLPSQQRALRLWDDTAYAEFAQSLILSGEIVALTQRNGSAAVALQEAFAAVLEGTPSKDAVEAALAALNLPIG